MVSKGLPRKSPPLRCYFRKMGVLRSIESTGAGLNAPAAPALESRGAEFVAMGAAGAATRAVIVSSVIATPLTVAASRVIAVALTPSTLPPSGTLRIRLPFSTSATHPLGVETVPTRRGVFGFAGAAAPNGSIVRVAGTALRTGGTFAESSVGISNAPAALPERSRSRS